MLNISWFILYLNPSLSIFFRRKTFVEPRVYTVKSNYSNILKYYLVSKIQKLLLLFKHNIFTHIPSILLCKLCI